MMPKIEPHRSWLPLQERAEREPPGRRRELLLQVRNHMEFEITGQLDPLMGTLTGSPVYHFWGNAPMEMSGEQAIRAFYRDMFERGGQQFEVVVERIIVDDGAVVTEGQVKQVHRGSALLAMGMNEVAGQAIAADDLVLTTTQLVTVWPADADGKLIGEDIYFGHDPFRNAEKIEAGDLPGYYSV